MLENDTEASDEGAVSVSAGSAIFHQKAPSASLFSVNLGKLIIHEWNDLNIHCFKSN